MRENERECVCVCEREREREREKEREREEREKWKGENFKFVHCVVKSFGLDSISRDNNLIVWIDNELQLIVSGDCLGVAGRCN